jgi:hypothetical protein
LMPAKAPQALFIPASDNARGKPVDMIRQR